MSGPDKCKWCGCAKVSSTAGGSLYFKCLTRYYEDRQWYISETCASNCVMQMPDLRQRIADAVAALTAIERHEADSDLGFGIVSKHGEWVLFEDLETVRDILTGKDSRDSESEQ